MQNKVPREETGKSKAVAQRAQAPHGRTPLTFSSHISDVDKRSRSASVSGCEGPSTSQSKVLREEKGKAKKAPPCLPVFDGRTPLNFVPLATPSISSKTSGACSANSNATKKAPLTKQASRPKTVKPLTAKQIREKYRGMVLRDFLQDIFQRRDAGDFAMKTPFLRGKVFFYCPQDYSSMTETSRKRSELVICSYIHERTCSNILFSSLGMGPPYSLTMTRLRSLISSLKEAKLTSRNDSGSNP